jgi:hypothetical protein
VVDVSGAEVGRIGEVLGEADVMLGVIVESGSLGATEYLPAESVAEIRDGEVTLTR